MKLVDDIVDGALNEAEPVQSLLRKCLVLAHRLPNDELRIWAERELDGYGSEDDLPEYRRLKTIAKGLFLGPLGSQMNNQPLPPAVLEPKHRAFAEEVFLRQPIAGYASFKPEGGGNPVIEWPPDLTLMYQEKFFQGYALNRAWQDVPASALIGLVDTVRNRVLKFALEIQTQLGVVADDPAALPPERVTQTVTNIIYGGQNVIGSQTRDIHQETRVTVRPGDRGTLRDALVELGVPETDIAALETAIQEDAQEAGGRPTFGGRVVGWLKALGTEGLKTGGEAGKAVATQAILTYLGLG